MVVRPPRRSRQSFRGGCGPRRTADRHGRQTRPPARYRHHPDHDHSARPAGHFPGARARRQARRSLPNLPQDAASRSSCSRREKAGELSSKTALYGGTSRKGNLRTLKGYHSGQPRRRRDWHRLVPRFWGSDPKWPTSGNYRRLGRNCVRLHVTDHPVCS